ncbi:hypothetical protein [Streptomyces sp. XD-27]|uniref:hypothetical protein n=1 Tax=Streptomyces sp. XD-27 TaxID=3062779 RepID=UPI0026F47572|nr:hypothetical protein [Streptomyces sp. XD-27]WKX71862.1 hypothetical protein Q3Y56_19930 [Streptomyces sp. XD-27]
MRRHIGRHIGWRRSVSRSAAIGLLAATGLLGGLATAPAHAEPLAGTAPRAATSYSFTSASGDYIGGGGSGSYTAPADKITVSGTVKRLTVSIRNSDDTDGWDIDLAAPAGEKLRPGVFRDAERASLATGRAPGLDVYGNGRGCNEVYGEFAIDQIKADASGKVTVLDATFTQHCESADAPPLTGTVKVGAYPLSYAYNSDAGDYIGGGRSGSHANSTSTFSLSGLANGFVRLDVSGKREQWQVRLSAPGDEALKAGRTYQANRMGDDGAAELDVTHNSRGCNRSNGEFTVKKLVTDKAGKVKALALTFVQHCEGGKPALRGTVHYYA